MHGAVGLLEEPGTAASGGIRERWHSVLRVLAGRDTVPGVIRGRAVRLLLDDGELGQDEAARSSITAGPCILRIVPSFATALGEELVEALAHSSQ